MSPIELVDLALDAGLELVDRGDVLRVRGPKPLPADLLDALRQHKQEILEHLRQGIGSARPPEPHRRCRSCRCGLQPNDADDGICGTCLWTCEHLAPRRIQ